MKLENLQLRNFRTYAGLNLSFDKRLSFITGANAAGKTNILEAVSLLSLGKSFRGAGDANLARHGANDYFIGAKYRRHDDAFHLEMGCDFSGSLKRKIKLNGKALTGRSALIGNLVCVIFSPSDIAIVEGGPTQRRRFLDMVLSSQNQDYLRDLVMYNRTIKQRNAMLKRIKQGKATPAELGVWNRTLTELAGRITDTRKEFVADFQSIFMDSLRRISGDRDSLELQLTYASEMEVDDFAGALEKYIRRDTALGYTTVGPHRQNLMFMGGENDIMHYGSQGQKRSLVLSLRISQFYFLKQRLGLSPILLIDDVIRELDARRRAAFVELLHECGQAIFTTPDLDGLEGVIRDMRSETRVFEVMGDGVVESPELDVIPGVGGA